LTRNALLAAIGAGVLLAPVGAAAAHAGGRVLVASDVVSIRIPGDPELDTTTRVEPDGTVAFPYVGRIKAAGLTEDELAQAIERRLVERQIIPGR
jgi:polysaccharide export outer membrane protein